MRICRHDGLVDIVHHALFQSHAVVLKEQRAFCEDQSHPGDVYHRDSQCGRPAFFDLSVCGTIPRLLIFLLFLATCTATAGELAKDLRSEAISRSRRGDRM